MIVAFFLLYPYSIVQMRKELEEKDGLIQSLNQSRNSLQDKLSTSESQVDTLRWGDNIK